MPGAGLRGWLEATVGAGAAGQAGHPLLLLLSESASPRGALALDPLGSQGRDGTVLPGVGAMAPGSNSMTPCALRQGPDPPPAPAAPCRQAAPGPGQGSGVRVGVSEQHWDQHSGGGRCASLTRTSRVLTALGLHAQGPEAGSAKGPACPHPRGWLPASRAGGGRQGGGAGPHRPEAIDRWGFAGDGGVLCSGGLSPAHPPGTIVRLVVTAWPGLPLQTAVLFKQDNRLRRSCAQAPMARKPPRTCQEQRKLGLGQLAGCPCRPAQRPLPRIRSRIPPRGGSASWDEPSVLRGLEVCMKVPSASQGPRTLDRKDHSLGSTGVPQDKRAQPSKATATLAWGCPASLGAGRGQPAAPHGHAATPLSGPTRGPCPPMQQESRERPAPMPQTHASVPCSH